MLLIIKFNARHLLAHVPESPRQFWIDRPTEHSRQFLIHLGWGRNNLSDIDVHAEDAPGPNPDLNGCCSLDLLRLTVNSTDERPHTDWLPH